MDKGAPPVTPLQIAYMLAKNHGLFIVEVTQKSGPAYVVYRRSPVRGERGIRLGRRANPSALLAFVRTFVTPGDTP